MHSICYSSDGKRLAYGIDLSSGVEGLSQYAVVDGKRGDPYITVVEGSLLFSADSRHLAYKAEMDDNFMMVLDGKAGKWYSEVIQLIAVFSPDNLRFAYAAEKDSKRMVIADGIEYEPYNEILSIGFSPDSKRVVYSVKQDNTEMVVVEGNKGRVYDNILGEGGIVFESPDVFHYLAKKGNAIYLVEEKIE